MLPRQAPHRGAPRCTFLKSLQHRLLETGSNQCKSTLLERFGVMLTYLRSVCRSSLRFVCAHAAIACEGTDNKEQCTHQERKGSGHCWKEEVSRQTSSQRSVQQCQHGPATAGLSRGSNHKSIESLLPLHAFVSRHLQLRRTHCTCMLPKINAPVKAVVLPLS